MKWFVRTLLYIKRALKKPSMWLMILILPLIAIGVNKLDVAKGDDEIGIKIGIHAEEGEGLADLTNNLVKRKGYLSFVNYEERDNLVNDVKNGSLDCGYIFPEDMLQRLDDGDLVKSISVVESPSTLLSEVSNEVIFSELLGFWGKYIAQDYLAEYGVQANIDGISDKYNNYIDNGDTFSLAFEREEVEDRAVLVSENTFSVSVRGIVAVFLLISALLSVVIWICDDKKGIGQFGIYNIIAVQFLTYISALITLVINKNGSEIGFESLLLFVYAIACVGFANCVKQLVGNVNAICGFIPIISIGSFVFCPIFVDLSRVLPITRIIEKIFLPSYYLRAVENVANLKWLVVVAILLNLVGFVAEKIKER